MRLVCISDTHNRHDALRLPDGDVLVHAGDLTGSGRPWEVETFARWFGAQPHKHKILIAGNHDWLFERDNEQARAFLGLHCPSAHYLQDTGIEIEGVRFWGSPWTPLFLNWAFNLKRGLALANKWVRVPSDTQVLITHGPPHGILDLTRHGRNVGCEELAAALENRLRPKVHVFGHIHEGYGTYTRNGTKFVNASSCTEFYEPVNAPVVVDL